MQFPWSKVGLGPPLDVPEIAVFGPGYGECILVHTGNGRWLIVDSCIESKTGLPVPLTYLKQLGVDPASAVDLVVATHWHDDHVRGLSEVVKSCHDAPFVCANVLTSPEFHKYVERITVGNFTSSGTGISEFHRIHQTLADSAGRRRRTLWASADRRLLTLSTSSFGIGCNVWSLSPSDEEFTRFLNFVASDMVTRGQAKRRAVSQRPNETSVVLGLEWGPASALLGSDLESFSGSGRGWGAIVNSTGRPRARATYLKVPHHGGLSAHHEGMWSEMLVDQPMSVLTPFSRGRALPSDEDIHRLRRYSANVYATARVASSASRVEMDRPVSKTLAEAGIKIRKPPALGLVRCRFQNNEWQSELFSDAYHL
jgi:beta-lactamase superfamily II metal-dependent hydrolase